MGALAIGTEQILAMPEGLLGSDVSLDGLPWWAVRDLNPRPVACKAEK